MTTPGEYFKRPRPAWEAHPMVRYWAKLKATSGVRRLVVEIYRPKEGLVFRPADIYVQAERDDGTASAPEKADWEDVLNEGLLHLQARAVSHEDEAKRFSLALQSAFEPVEAHFGETFFSPVLRETVAEGPFAEGPNVARMLSRIHPGNPQKAASWDECREMIRNVLETRWEELTSQRFLGYTEQEAEGILESALAKYLDERFNISNREALGWG